MTQTTARIPTPTAAPTGPAPRTAGRRCRPAPRFDQPLFDRLPLDRPESAPSGVPSAASSSGTDAGGCLFARGTRPSFLRTAEDVARASGRRFRPLSTPDPGGTRHHGAGTVDLVLPVFGTADALVLETECVPGLLDALERSAHVRPPGSVVVVGHEGGADPWSAAGLLAGWAPRPDVVQFPQGRGWLADHLSPEAGRSGREPVLGVVGACGGIGTSSMALWLAARATEDGRPAAVVDAVGTGSGLDTCVSSRTEPGLRWEELERLPTMPTAGDLLSALPAPHGLPVLTASLAPDSAGHEPRLGMTADGRGTDRQVSDRVHEQWAATEILSEAVLPVVDLGAAHALLGAHRIESQWIPRCSALVMLVPFTLRGLCQARSALAQWAPLLPVVPVGVGPRICDVSAAEAGAAIGAPLRAVVPPVGAVCEAAEAGRLLEAGYRRALRVPVAETMAAVLEAVDPRTSPTGSAARAFRPRTRSRR